MTGSPGEHGLDHHHGQALEVAWEDEDVRGREEGRDVLAVAEHFEARAEAGGGEEGGEVGAVVGGEPFADDP